MKGHHTPHSEETKKKISQKKKANPSRFWLGKKRPEANKWLNSPEARRKRSKTMTGIKHPPEFGEKQRQLKLKNPIRYWLGKKRPDISGENNHNWKGGVSSNKEYTSWQKNLYHKRRREAEGSHTFGEWITLKEQYGFMCPSCKVKEPNITLTQDHIIPLSRGGSNYISNIQPLCLKCNMKKHTSTTKYERE